MVMIEKLIILKYYAIHILGTPGPNRSITSIFLKNPSRLGWDDTNYRYWLQVLTVSRFVLSLQDKMIESISFYGVDTSIRYRTVSVHVRSLYDRLSV